LDLLAKVGSDIDHGRRLFLELAVTESVEDFLDVTFAADLDPTFALVVLDVQAAELGGFEID
jgi:hypothetical protein